MNKRITLEKLTAFFTKHPARFFLLGALIWLSLMCILNSMDVGENGFSWHDLLVEANGMVFDLLVFGVLLSIYEALREKRAKIEQLYEEISDYRGWDEKEATFRIVGAIKRLNRLGMYYFDLKDCFLPEADLRGANLRGSNFNRANLAKAKLQEINVWDVTLWAPEHQITDLQDADFNDAYLQGADLRGANLQGANFRRANLKGVDLRKATVGVDWFEILEGWEVVGLEEIKEQYRIDENGILQLK